MNLIKKIIKEEISKIILTEDIDDFYETLSMMPYDIFSDIKKKRKIKFDVIPKNKYHLAVKEFSTNGKILRFPEKYILDWKDLVLNNIAKLHVLTQINGHSTYWPEDEFNDVFDDDGQFSKWIKFKNNKSGEELFKKNDFFTANTYLDEVYNSDEYLPTFSNGQFLVSDYGLESLMELARKLCNQDDVDKIIVTLSMIMDVVHQRSDLAELFIEGGSQSLYYISNY